MVVDNRDKILSFIKGKGPVLPFQIAKHIGTDIIMASAHLAELTATHKAKISHIKVGGSPLYYLPGQEEMLSNFVGSLNEKELKAYNFLKEKLILKDSELSPLNRVIFGELKDFAMPLNVNFNGVSESFWKWHLATDREVESGIKSILNIQEEEPRKQEVQKKIEAVEERRQESPGKVDEKRKEVQEKLEKVEKPSKKDSKARKEKKEKSVFYDSVLSFFEKSKITVIETDVIKKGTEMDFIIEVPSVVGNLRCYCKAKSKKKIDEDELSSFFVKAQYKKMQLILVSDGDLSPKAGDMLRKELSGMIFRRL
jgi:hypothetical protein